jgi:hypothetical protein
LLIQDNSLLRGVKKQINYRALNQAYKSPFGGLNNITLTIRNDQSVFTIWMVAAIVAAVPATLKITNPRGRIIGSKFNHHSLGVKQFPTTTE